MTYQQAIIPLIEDAYKNLFANAEPLADKLDYKPSDAARTPLQLLQECTTAPAMLAQTIRAGEMPKDMDMSEEATAETYKGLTDISACRERWESTKEDTFAAIREFPQARLQEKIETPWGTFPWFDFISYLYWNPMWHAGQLSYIQTIHGDSEMHMA